MATLSVVEQDVISALLNLGCNRPTAEGAVRKAKATGVPGEFEPLFRKSLELAVTPFIANMGLVPRGAPLPEKEELTLA